MTPPPIDKQQITLPSAAALILLTFGIGAGWTVHETRLSAMERQLERNDKLLNAICRKLSCDAEGMRE